MLDYQRLKMDVLALGLLAACVFVGLALYSHDAADAPATLEYPPSTVVLNLCGPAGARVAHALNATFGLAAWLVLAVLVLIDLRLFSRQGVPDLGARACGWMLVIVAACGAMQLFAPNVGHASVLGSGGYVGAWGRTVLTEHFSTYGTLIILSTLLATGLLLVAETWMLRLLLRTAAWPALIVLWPVYRRREPPEDGGTALQELSGCEADREGPLSVIEAPLEDAGCCADDALDGDAPFKVNPPICAPTLRDEVRATLDANDRQAEETHYALPDLDLLEDAEEFPFELLARKAQTTAVTIEKTFAEFGLNVKVSEIDTGPVVTQFELALEPGLRVSKVISLADDLAIALRVPAVRVVSPIPGRNTVGVEVPNDKRVMVRLRELIEAGGQQVDKARIPVFLGKDVSGRPLVVDLAQMPHLLIAGRTGTGKSVCLNTLIVSLLMTRSPEDVRMLMIDPKMVELSPYMRIPHLMHPVITDMKKAEAVLAWAVDKMEERYDLLARAGVRHLDSYNKLGKEAVLERLGLGPDDEEAAGISEHMPYIVIVADEMADMMMTSGKDVEGHIIRLAQKSRAVGIHLVLATQKPTVDVITGLIKSNLPARISFQVSSRTDSRVVLDECGAERLLGNGDMLYLAPGTSDLTRAQGTYVSDEEVHAVIDFFRDRGPQYSAEIAQATSAAAARSDGGEGARERDDMYEQAVEVVIREGRGSVSLLQRALGVGYGRGARMIDHMAEDGIVGEYNGSKCREVVMTLEQWRGRRAGVEEGEAALVS